MLLKFKQVKYDIVTH